MLFKQCNLIYRYHHRLVIKQNVTSLLHNNVRTSSTTVNKKNNIKFDGPSLKDFIVKKLPKEQTELIKNEDKIPYVDMVNPGQNRKGK